MSTWCPVAHQRQWRFQGNSIVNITPVYFLQVCAQKAIFAEGHRVSISELISLQFFYFQRVVNLFVLFCNSPISCCSPGSLSFVVRWRQHELFNSLPRPSWKTALRRQYTRRPSPWRLKLSESREGDNVMSFCNPFLILYFLALPWCYSSVLVRFFEVSSNL